MKESAAEARAKAESHAPQVPAPFAARARRQDGSLGVADPIDDLADIFFNATCWGYVHMRQRDRWSHARARRHLKRVLLAGAIAGA